MIDLKKFNLYYDFVMFLIDLNHHYFSGHFYFILSIIICLLIYFEVSLLLNLFV